MFTVAGVALVALLTLLNITVSVGTLNGLILFANIIQANRSTFLPPIYNIQCKHSYCDSEYIYFVGKLGFGYSNLSIRRADYLCENLAAIPIPSIHSHNSWCHNRG